MLAAPDLHGKGTGADVDVTLAALTTLQMLTAPGSSCLITLRQIMCPHLDVVIAGKAPQPFAVAVQARHGFPIPLGVDKGCADLRMASSTVPQAESNVSQMTNVTNSEACMHAASANIRRQLDGCSNWCPRWLDGCGSHTGHKIKFQKTATGSRAYLITHP